MVRAIYAAYHRRRIAKVGLGHIQPIEHSNRLACWMVPRMDDPVRADVTTLLGDIRGGRPHAEHELVNLVYEDLRRQARRLMGRERPGHTLQTTGLLNEAYLRLFDQEQLAGLKNRVHFFGAAIRAMRRVLVEHARYRASKKRGGNQEVLPLDEALDAYEQQGIDIVALDEALDQLHAMNSRQYDVVSLRFFGGMSMPEIAEHLQISLSTVESDWRISRAWLKTKIADEDS